MNVTKIILIALISSITTLLTLWVAGGLKVSGWYIPVLILVTAAIISDRARLGSIAEFFKL